MRKILVILILFGFTIQAQSKRDPRMVGMAGAYTTGANGVFSVGFNPGIIGLQQNDPFLIQAAQLDLGISLDNEDEQQLFLLFVDEVILCNK